MSENNRNPIEKCRKKLSQFTTMNVIDGQASLVIYASLIFYSLTIDNILNIIVLLILAGVTIAMLTGENGILSQANESKTKTEIAEAKERAQVDILGWQTKEMTEGRDGNLNDSVIKSILTGKEYVKDAKENSFIAKKGNHEILYSELYESTGGVVPPVDEGVKPGEIVTETKKDNYSDGKNTATIPGGFTVSGIASEQIIDNGLVIYDIPKGVTPNWTEDTNADGVPDIQTKYNQFVWIPVKDEASYQRDFSYPSDYSATAENTLTDTGYLPEGINQVADTAENNEKAERESVLKYNGFYIGRYEAGKDADGTTVVSKQNVTVYTKKPQIEFKEMAKRMYNNNIVKSAMSSGIQWDMVMHFVDGEYDATGEKKFNVRVYDETRHNGNAVVKSGKNNNDKVQNIYDLEGNCNEYVAEKNNTSDPFLFRGGNLLEISDSIASIRHSFDGCADSFKTFRPTLYIM